MYCSNCPLNLDRKNKTAKVTCPIMSGGDPLDIIDHYNGSCSDVALAKRWSELSVSSQKLIAYGYDMKKSDWPILDWSKIATEKAVSRQLRKQIKEQKLRAAAAERAASATTEERETQISIPSPLVRRTPINIVMDILVNKEWISIVGDESDDELRQILQLNIDDNLIDEIEIITALHGEDKPAPEYTVYHDIHEGGIRDYTVYKDGKAVDCFLDEDSVTAIVGSDDWKENVIDCDWRE